MDALGILVKEFGKMSEIILKIRHAITGFRIIGVFLWLTGLFLAASPGTVRADSGSAVLFTDRTWALSGDTLWFRVSWAGDINAMGNVIHVQLENLSNEIIAGVMVTIDDKRGEGYIPVPDSLATGVYWLRGYSGYSRNDESATILSRLVTVLHRFDRDIQELIVPSSVIPVNGTVPDDLVKLQLNQDFWSHGETISFSVELDNGAGQLVRDLTVSTFLDMPVPIDLTGHYETSVTPALTVQGLKFPPEKNGFLVEGVVRPKLGESLPERSLVMLSISDSIPYFDYYVTDEKGYFQFMLSSAYGTAEIFVRAVSENGQELYADLTEGLLTGSEIPGISNKQLSQDEVSELTNVLESAWFERIFGGEAVWHEPEFRMDHPFGQAFYGEPYQRVYPAEFFDLPDFTEISRELLPGVRFRQRDNRFNIQLLNLAEKFYFENSPLRLINGIPVYDNDLLHGLNSNDISYIDIILQERVFGDISFKGVLAIYLNEGNEEWIQGQHNLGRHLIPCLQIKKTGQYSKAISGNGLDQLPDLRRVFLFEPIDTSAGRTIFSFQPSDLKGTLVVRIEGITHDNEPFEIIRKIEMQ